MTPDQALALETRLAELEARQQIRDVIQRSCAGLDRCDTQLFGSVFWPEAHYEGGPVQGLARDFVEPLLLQFFPAICALSQHIACSTRIRLSGATATTETYFISHLLSHANRESIEAIIGAGKLVELGNDVTRQYEAFIGARYLDDLEKRSDEWRIVRRRVAADWNHVGPYSGSTDGGAWGFFALHGKQDRTDPLYNTERS